MAEKLMTTRSAEVTVADEKLRRLSWRQMRFLAARLLCETDSEAAKLADVSFRSVMDWKDTPEFVDVYRELAHGGLALAQAMVSDMMGQAAETLLELLHSDRPSVRLKAAELVLTLGGMGKGTDAAPGTTQAKTLLLLQQIRMVSERNDDN